jgi:hypothetical protein
VKAQKAGLASSKENEAAANKVATAQKGVSVAERTLSGDLANVHKATDGLSLAQKEAAAPPKALAAAQEKLKKAHEAVSVASLKVKKDSSALGEVLANLAKISMGQAQKASETTAGKLRVLHATLNEVEAEIGKKLEPAIMKLVEAMLKIIGFFKQHTTAAKALAIALGLVAIAWPITKVIGLVSAIGKLVVLSKIAGLVKMLWSGLVALGTSEAIVGGETVTLGFSFAALGTAIGGVLLSVAPFLAAFGVGGAIGLGINSLYKSITGALGPTEKLASLLGKTGEEGPSASLLAGSKHAKERLAQAEAKYPKMALGGIVSKPTLVEVGEAGPEAIIPLASGGLTAPQGFSSLPNIGAGTSSTNPSGGGLHIDNLTVNGMSTPSPVVVSELYSRLRPLLV